MKEKKLNKSKVLTFMQGTTSKKMFLFLVLFFAVCTVEVIAQTNGVSAINSVTEEIKKYFKPLTGLLYIVIGIIALFGIIQCVNKFQSGDPNATKVVAAWVFAVVFAILGVIYLQKMLNIS